MPERKVRLLAARGPEGGITHRREHLRPPPHPPTPATEFSTRLRQAMCDVGLEPRPGVLLNLFNSRYWGRSVSFQAVSRWLRGEALPTQDKLVVLAEILRVDPEALRFGSRVQNQIRERERRWGPEGGYLEIETFDSFLKLPPVQRKLIREIIMLFEKANSGAGDTGTASPRYSHREMSRDLAPQQQPKS